MRRVAAELADDVQQDGARLRALRVELDLALAGIGFDALQPLEEIVIPRCAPELAVSDGFEADRLLLADDVFDGAILGRGERFGADLAAAEDTFSAAGRSRLPTWSARNGGIVRCIFMSFSFPSRSSARQRRIK
jgi:hypothetical protein